MTRRHRGSSLLAAVPVLASESLLTPKGRSAAETQTASESGTAQCPSLGPQLHSCWVLQDDKPAAVLVLTANGWLLSLSLAHASVGVIACVGLRVSDCT